MTEALQGPSPKGPTIREQVNAQRIGRARIIGYWIGLCLIFGLIAFALVVFGLRETVTIESQRGPITLMTLPPGAAVALSVALMLTLSDLVIRRRHDRNRSGIDGIIWFVLLVGSEVSHLFGLLPALVPWLDAVTGLLGLYLFVVCVLLPGTKGPNRYGPDPRGT